MGKFKIIRCGSFFDLVIVVTPANARYETENAKYYRYASWQIDEHKPGVFNEISRNSALGYFSGIADGIGFELLPKQTFPSLEDVLKYVRGKRYRLRKKYNETEKRKKLLPES